MRPVYCPEDCIKIVNAANQLGFDCTLKQAEELWKEHSKNYCARWLSLNNLESGELNLAIVSYFNGDNK